MILFGILRDRCGQRRQAKGRATMKMAMATAAPATVTMRMVMCLRPESCQEMVWLLPLHSGNCLQLPRPLARPVLAARGSALVEKVRSLRMQACTPQIVVSHSNPLYGANYCSGQSCENTGFGFYCQSHCKSDVKPAPGSR